MPSLHSEQFGADDAVPMLLMHGFLSANAQWMLNRDELAEHHRLIGVELLGHGRSDAPVELDFYQRDRAVALIEDVRERHKIARWFVCGQSLGGAIAIHYCLRHPERVHGLIFTNSRAAFGIKRVGVSRDSDEPAPVLRSTRDIPVHPINATRLDESLKTALVAAADHVPLHVVSNYTALRHTWRSTERMGELSMPVLLVNGRWEKAFQPFGDVAKATIPDLEVVTLEGGHAINAEQPEAFNEAVLSFTARVGLQTPPSQ